MKQTEIVLASNNAHKTEEFRRYFRESGLSVEIITMREAGFDAEIVEDADTFEGNAYLKAKAVCDATGMCAIADDSGLEVDALGGAPGVHSARYCGRHGDDEANNQKLLLELKEVPDEKRTARFVCTLVFVDTDGSELIARGTCEGKIGYEERGKNGFGYDPLFVSDDCGGLTTAEVPPEKKDAISHRGEALRQFIREFEKLT